MGTGLLRRHRDALEKLREQDAVQEIAEVKAGIAAPVAEPEPVTEPAYDAVSTPHKSRRAKAQNAE